MEIIAEDSFKANADSCTVIHTFWPKFSTKKY